jgi:hypothetical protein
MSWAEREQGRVPTLRPRGGGEGGGVWAVHGTRQKEGWGSDQWQSCGRDRGSIRSVRQGTSAHEQRMRCAWAGWFWAVGLVGREGSEPGPRRIGPFLFIEIF